MDSVGTHDKELALLFLSNYIRNMHKQLLPIKFNKTLMIPIGELDKYRIVNNVLCTHTAIYSH